MRFYELLEALPNFVTGNKMPDVNTSPSTPYGRPGYDDFSGEDEPSSSAPQTSIRPQPRPTPRHREDDPTVTKSTSGEDEYQGVDPGFFIGVMDIMRRAGVSVVVNSGKRTYERQAELYRNRGNSAVAHPDSAPHVQANALDLSLTPMDDPEILKNIIRMLAQEGPDIKGIGIYSSHIHVDDYGSRRRFWYGTKSVENELAYQLNNFLIRFKDNRWDDI